MDKAAEHGEFLNMLNEHRGAVHRVCRTYADNPDEREELFQEVVYQLWRAYPSYRRQASPLTWLYRIALNAAITSLRRKTRRPAHVALEAAFAVPSREMSAASDERVELMYRAIRRLDDVERALLMCSLDGLGYKQIAEVLGLSESNVGVRLNRTKTKLQALVKEMR